MKKSTTRGVHRTRKVKIPIGIEKVLVRAADDPVFRQALMDSRERALKEQGSDLSQAEFEILLSIPNATLLAMVSHVDLKKHSRRNFMKGVMTAAFVAASAATMAECSRNVEGAQAADPPKKSAVVEAQELYYDGGAAPTKPKPLEPTVGEKPGDREVDTPVTRGIDPDEPPPPPPSDPDVIETEETPVPAGIPPIDPKVVPDSETRIINEMSIGGISPSDGPHIEIEAPETMGEGGHDPGLDGE